MKIRRLFKVIQLMTLVFASHFTFGQVPQNGLQESKPQAYVLTNATIVLSPGEIIENGKMVIQDDKIVSIGKLIKIPKNAVEIDCDDQFIYPAFIELNSDLGMTELKSNSSSRGPQLESSKKGAFYWNESIHPEIDAATIYTDDAKNRLNLLKSGFGYVLTHQNDGISRGTGVLVALNSSDENEAMTDWCSSAFFSFQKGVSRQSYPSSQMGSIALLRQALYDGKWYADQKNVDRNLSLEALNKQTLLPQFFVVNDKWELLRAQKIANEFKFKYNFLGAGDEYAIVDELNDMKANVVIPINFPEAYDVGNPYVARQIPLSDLKHWELAPKNPAILAENAINFSITSKGNKTANDFWKHIRVAIQNGLSEEDALKALTINPANILGISNYAGTIAEGKKASFLIFDKNPFTDEGQLMESWVLGERIVHSKKQKNDIAGTYNLLIDQRKLPLSISGTWPQLKGQIITKVVKIEDDIAKEDTVKTQVKVLLSENDITLNFEMSDNIWDGAITLRGKVNSKLGVFEGDGLLPTGKWIKWTGVKTESPKKKSVDSIEEGPTQSDSLAKSWFPNMAYGFDSIPEAENLVITNATVWTNEEAGIIDNATVVVENGKIVFCGTGRYKEPKNARVIDAKGMHLTTGIIDEHSHIAISKGVNEGGQAISAEVSIGDVVHSDDINIYRQLAGGVTTSQLLHGSANPIGGQSAIIKLKWGSTPEEMLIDNAPKFIKFALGENVKQSNWGPYNNVRFPQTRMGVEQVYYDGFERARNYLEAKKRYSSGELKEKPRVDLELEVLGEILEGERNITCHSYVQSEINMLMHVADSLGFKINTFTHILEGYKVADKMAEHGAGGSTFSDWWAYKYEVNDAIPYNAKMMHDQGIVVAINSDDAEMGRRLNQEAAKAVKYGGMSEEEAWKMVTLNPAKLLHLDDRLGSVKEGKDADLVLWSDNPLSVFAKVNYTIIDGTVLFERGLQPELEARNQAERARIISKMLYANANGNKKPFVKQKKGHFHCNTMGEEATNEENHH